MRRSAVATGPIQSDVELGENERSEIDDRNRSPSSAPAVNPRADGQHALPAEHQVAERLDELGIAAVGLQGSERTLRLLDVRNAPKSSIDSWGV